MAKGIMWGWGLGERDAREGRGEEKRWGRREGLRGDRKSKGTFRAGGPVNTNSRVGIQKGWVRVHEQKNIVCLLVRKCNLCWAYSALDGSHLCDDCEDRASDALGDEQLSERPRVQRSSTSCRYTADTRLHPGQSTARRRTNSGQNST